MSTIDQTDTQKFDNALAGSASTFVVLDVTDRGVVLPDDLGTSINISNQNLLIYAESITLKSDIIWPGKNIGIACSSLTLAQPSIAIDVSGSPGGNVVPAASGKGTTGKPGGVGGSIWIYCEQMSESIAAGLTLRANGGDGGPGGATSDASGSGGDGGVGGNAGVISFLWGTQAGHALVKLFQLSSTSWTGILGQSASISAATESLLTSQEYNSLQSTLSLYTQYVASAKTCYGAVRNLLAYPKAVSSGLAASLGTFQTGLQTILASREGPDLVDSSLAVNTDAVNAAAVQCLKTYKAKQPINEATLSAAIPVATVPWGGTADSALRRSLIGVTADIEPLYQATYNAIEKSCQVIQGAGGVGGPSFGPNPSYGVRGKSGTAGTFSFRELLFDGSSDDLDVVLAFASPDQCQMLLNKANALFFQNTWDAVQSASVLYQRLLKRLSFSPTLFSPPTTAPTAPPVPPPESSLQKSYDKLEYSWNITVSWAEQIQSVYSQAKSFNNQIMSGNDMFGHGPLWVPRLGYGHYSSKIDNFLTPLQMIETAYESALAVKASLTDIASGQNAAAAGSARASDRIQLLTDTNGPMVASADTIAQYTPLLKAKVREIQTELQQIANDIQSSLNLDPMDIIAALSTVAMAPSVPLALVEGGKVTYDAFTTVKTSTGATVNKDYVISEIGSAGSTLAALSQGFSTRQDQEIEPDDPGGVKLLAAMSDITKLYDEFKASIPASAGTNLLQSLSDLQDLATTRNNAVISYNSALELLRQAVTDQAYYQKQQTAYGNQAAKTLNPGLPSVLLWLRRTRDNFALETMRMMNYANRAIYYWGLVQPYDFAAPGPLQDYTSLSTAKIALGNSAEDALNVFAGVAGNAYPVSGRQGALYKLDFGQLITLSTPRTIPPTASSPGDTYYSLTVQLAPGSVDDSGGLPLFAGCANIRVSRVRLWLIGASVSANLSGEEPIKIVITQLGSETMQDSRRQSLQFQHDPVVMEFDYDSKGVQLASDCTDSRVLNTQFLAEYYLGQNTPQDLSVAAIGPWSGWTFEIRGSDNSNLDMSGLTDAYIEFGGYYSPFKFDESFRKRHAVSPRENVHSAPSRRANGVTGQSPVDVTPKIPQASTKMHPVADHMPELDDPDVMKTKPSPASGRTPKPHVNGTKTITSHSSSVKPLEPVTKTWPPRNPLPGRTNPPSVSQAIVRPTATTKTSADHTQSRTSPELHPAGNLHQPSRRRMTFKDPALFPRKSTPHHPASNPPALSSDPFPSTITIPQGGSFSLPRIVPPAGAGGVHTTFMYDSRHLSMMDPDPEAKGAVRFTAKPEVRERTGTRVGVIWIEEGGKVDGNTVRVEIFGDITGEEGGVRGLRGEEGMGKQI